MSVEDSVKKYLELSEKITETRKELTRLTLEREKLKDGLYGLVEKVIYFDGKIYTADKSGCLLELEAYE